MMNLKDLQESISSIMEGKIGTFYHGSTSNIKSFVDDFVGKGNDEYGPGIYFSNREWIARGYAEPNGYIYRCDLDFRNELSVNTKFNLNQIKTLIAKSPDEYAASNWDEDEVTAHRIALNNYLDSYDQNMLEIFMQIWADWYMDYPVDFVRNVVAMGYDGSVHNLGNPDVDGITDDTLYIVVYNPKSIKLIESYPYQQKVEKPQEPEKVQPHSIVTNSPGSDDNILQTTKS